jgi:DNA invertase Pin-like site-specific DNA recombinase
MQLDDLMEVAERFEWNVVQVYDDTGFSGAKGPDARPQLRRLLADAHKRKFDLLAVWSVDRLGRSVLDLVTILQDLHAKGVEVFAYKQGLDSSSTSGKMMWQLLSVFAEFERGVIRERVVAGLERAKAKGVRLGRPSNVTQDTPTRVMQLRRRGLNVVQVAKELRVGVSYVSRICREKAVEPA